MCAVVCVRAQFAGVAGSAAGYLFTGMVLDVWVEPGKEPPGQTPSDPTWVGAWWLGFAIACAPMAALGLVGVGFPKYLPST